VLTAALRRKLRGEGEGEGRRLRWQYMVDELHIPI
jgi:hypothetical protein